jgi:hypothetical protein
MNNTIINTSTDTSNNNDNNDDILVLLSSDSSVSNGPLTNGSTEQEILQGVAPPFIMFILAHANLCINARAINPKP